MERFEYGTWKIEGDFIVLPNRKLRINSIIEVYFNRAKDEGSSCSLMIVRDGEMLELLAPNERQDEIKKTAEKISKEINRDSGESDGQNRDSSKERNSTKNESYNDYVKADKSKFNHPEVQKNYKIALLVGVEFLGFAILNIVMGMYFLISLADDGFLIFALAMVLVGIVFFVVAMKGLQKAKNIKEHPETIITPEEKRQQVRAEAIPDYVHREISQIKKDLSSKKKVKKIIEERRLIAVLEGVASDKSGAESGSYVFLFRTDKRVLSYACKIDEIFIRTPMYFADKVKGDYVHYNPSKYVYTGVTYGGVTMGGITDVGNYHSLETLHSDRYAMMFQPSDDFIFLVQKIHLNDELFARACRESAVSKYLDKTDKCISVFNFTSSPKYGKAFDSYVNSGQTEKAQIAMNMEGFEKFLPFNECYGILQWFQENITRASSR